ncbi:MAG: glycerate kinase [Woeseiaceae bacterium]|nr:glycerate kinase [Woeseiaceae bacterium]
MDARRTLLRSLFDAAVQAAMPANCMSDWLPARPAGEVVIIGAGKAAASMAVELERHWQAPLQGAVIVPHGHGVPCHCVDVLEASHPLPDETSVAATRALLERVGGLTADHTVVCLLSGGGSSLLAQPLAGVSLAGKHRIAAELLRCGAPIHEINAVRKKLSAIKGGKLALACAPARVITLIISDVPGNDPAVVASGPTLPDPASADDALSILSRYEITVSSAVLEAMRAGDLPATRRIESDVHILATNDDALQAAATQAIEAGITPYILGDLRGDARELAAEHARLALDIAAMHGPLTPPAVILSGGEATVRVSGQGRGGRNGEYLLELALALNGHPAVSALACDTDGIDGSGDNAGAFIGPGTLQRATAQSIDARALQACNDSYRLFAATSDLIVTGPTHTNVNDFRAVLIDA